MTFMQMVLTHLIILTTAVLSRRFEKPLQSIGLGHIVAPSQATRKMRVMRHPHGFHQHSRFSSLLRLSRGFEGIAGRGLLEFKLRSVKHVVASAVIFVLKVLLSNLSLMYEHLRPTVVSCVDSDFQPYRCSDVHALQDCHCLPDYAIHGNDTENILLCANDFINRFSHLCASLRAVRSQARCDLDWRPLICVCSTLPHHPPSGLQEDHLRPGPARRDSYIHKRRRFRHHKDRDQSVLAYAPLYLNDLDTHSPAVCGSLRRIVAPAQEA